MAAWLRATLRLGGDGGESNEDAMIGGLIVAEAITRLRGRP